jgi:hypothetical protein
VRFMVGLYCLSISVQSLFYHDNELAGNSGGSKLPSPTPPYSPSVRPSGAPPAPPPPYAVGPLAVRFSGINVATTGCLQFVFV